MISYIEGDPCCGPADSLLLHWKECSGWMYMPFVAMRKLGKWKDLEGKYDVHFFRPFFGG